jgi:hypothetical protein
MVVGVADQHRERHPAPQLAQVLAGVWRLRLDRGGDVEVAALVAVDGLQQGHRAGVADPSLADSVEAVHDQDGRVGDDVQSGIRHPDPGLPRQLQGYPLPAHDVPLV